MLPECSKGEGKPIFDLAHRLYSHQLRISICGGPFPHGWQAPRSCGNRHNGTERQMVSRRVVLVLGLGSIIGLTGCSGPGSTSSPPPPPPPNGVLFVSPPPKSLAVKASATLVAAATFPIGSTGGNSQVTWSLTCGSTGACGSFSPNDDASGITYTAPAAIPSGGTVTVTATSQEDGTQSTSASITLVTSQCALSGYGSERVIVIDHTKVHNSDQTDFPFMYIGRAHV